MKTPFTKVDGGDLCAAPSRLSAAWPRRFRHAPSAISGGRHELQVALPRRALSDVGGDEPTTPRLTHQARLRRSGPVAIACVPGAHSRPTPAARMSSEPPCGSRRPRVPDVVRGTGFGRVSPATAQPDWQRSAAIGEFESMPRKRASGSSPTGGRGHSLSVRGCRSGSTCSPGIRPAVFRSYPHLRRVRVNTQPHIPVINVRKSLGIPTRVARRT